ncbi:MAG TPA: pyruvate synthase subunit PorB [Dehalococcoidales bacterium]|nr:pyruvate synthase subunit PorB [Dehalococcoidales bacterium]
MSKQTTIDPKERLAPGHRACVGCAEATAVRLVCKEMGDNVIIANATGCMEIISSQLPYTSWTVPWIHTLFDNTAAVTSGIEAAIKAMTRKGIRDLSKVKAVGMAGDGGTADIGMQALSGALERGHNMLYICFDNEAYMNTGVQRSSSTPYGASTTTQPAGKNSVGQITWKKNVPAIAAAHGIPYVATACPSHYKDLMNKVRKAMDINGPSYLQILSPCPTGWRCPTDNAIEVGRMAVQCGAFPLYEVENGYYKLNYKPENLKPVADYLKTQGRFRHLTENDIKKIQAKINEDWKKLKDLDAMNPNK